jgi:putative NADH-flavin reductase
MALLVCTRCYWHIGSAAQERIDEIAKTQQVIQRTDERRILWCGGSGLEVRPIGGDQRLTSVRQNEDELQAAGHARLAEYLQRLSLEGVMRAGDRHALRKVLTVGSVWCFPSIESITTN